MRKWIFIVLLAVFLDGGAASAQPRVTAVDHCTAALAAVGYAGAYLLSCSRSLATRIYQCSVTEYARLAMDWQGANAEALQQADQLQRREMGLKLVEPSVKGCRILWGEAD